MMSTHNFYRKRIGKDICISFDVKTNGEFIPLEGRNLTLELTHEYGNRKKIPFTVSGHKVTLTFHGREQQMVGRYRLTLWENLGCDGQSVVDTCDGFELVPCSCQENDGGADGLEVESIDLGAVSLEVGVRGDSAYETWLKDGHEGTEEDFLAWLREPAASAAAVALASAKRAEDAAGLAGKAISDIGATEAEIERAETLRSEAEKQRNESESSRISAEEARSTAEQQRQAATEKAIRNADTATLKAMQASEEANKGAENVKNTLNELEDANFITAEETRDIESPSGVILANALLKVKQVLTKEEMSVIEKNLTGGGTYMRPLFEAAGAVYNESTGYYELYAGEGGLTDITEEEMTTIYNAYHGDKRNNYSSLFSGASNVRTNIKLSAPVGVADMSSAFQGSNKIEVACIRALPNTINSCFRDCPKLRKVIGTLSLQYCTNANAAFMNCIALEECRITNLKSNISFSDSPKLSNQSILYILKNSAATASITVTLHPTAFAHAASNAEIQATLAAHPLVVLVQAEV